MRSSSCAIDDPASSSCEQWVQDQVVPRRAGSAIWTRVQPETIPPSAAAITHPSWNQSTDRQEGQRTSATDDEASTPPIVQHRAPAATGDNAAMPANTRRTGPSRSRRPAGDTSWDQVATWYDGWVGDQGSRYHQALAVPAALELLNPRRGDRVLEIGAGQGVLAPRIAAAGARYTGVDSSAKLIDSARRRHGRSGEFLVGDARRLTAVPGLEPASFDAAVFLLSIQDMDPLDLVLASASWAVRTPGRIVIVMTHPSFRQPRHAGWGFDEGRKLVYRRVDAYLTPMAVPMKALGDRPATRSFHRPLSAYVNGLAAEGFAVDAMLEIPDALDDRRKQSDRAGGRAAAEIPLFLALRAVR